MPSRGQGPPCTGRSDFRTRAGARGTPAGAAQPPSPETNTSAKPHYRRSRRSCRAGHGRRCRMHDRVVGRRRGHGPLRGRSLAETPPAAHSSSPSPTAPASASLGRYVPVGPTAFGSPGLTQERAVHGAVAPAREVPPVSLVAARGVFKGRQRPRKPPHSSGDASPATCSAR